RILGEEVDHDDARFIHRVHGEPIIISFEYALFRRHAHGILDDAEQAEYASYRRQPCQNRIEFRTLAEFELRDHFAGEIARENELSLARHRLLVDGAVHRVLISVGAQINVIAPLDEDARLRQIS